MKQKANLLTIVAFAALSLAPAGATVIIAQSFGGTDTSALSGTSAPTFSSAITSAGGSATWSAAASFKVNGSVTYSGSAGLNLGTYISDTKGTPDGLFTMTSTISQVTGGSGASTWITMNFFNTKEDSGVGSGFSPGTVVYADPNEGVGIAIRRAASGLTYFEKTPDGTGTVTTNWATVTEDVTFTVELDLRTWNGTTDFGSLKFFRSGTTGVQDTRSLTEDYNFSHVGFSAAGGPTSSVSAFSLSQIPEPSSSLLALVGGVAILRRRR